VTITLYNTLTREKSEFVPFDSSNVRMYVCGPTVYDFAHIGNARPILVFDVLYRLLRHIYGPEHVTYVRNITDVDDKINARATEEKISIRELTNSTLAQFHEDVDMLGALRPDIEPRATEHIPQMIVLIETLVENKFAYAEEGHVLFDVSSMKKYGQLSGRSVDEMIAGARVEVAPYKKNPMDFVLWKPSSGEEPGWESPWGWGRPGWHVECSAMSAVHLGNTFDIHGGGIDLVFPHHENEIAQSCSAHATDIMAQVWMHNGYLQVEGQKMSKSLGNFITIHDVLKKAPGEAVRLAMLITHYRQPINWTTKSLLEARRTLDQWYSICADCEADKILPENFVEVLSDDLNTPKAIAAMHQLKNRYAGGDQKAAGALKACGIFLGILCQTAETWASWRPAGREIDEQEIEKLIAAREIARENKDWDDADRIRDVLNKMGVTIKDGADGTTWELKP